MHEVALAVSLVNEAAFYPAVSAIFEAQTDVRGHVPIPPRTRVLSCQRTNRARTRTHFWVGVRLAVAAAADAK